MTNRIGPYNLVKQVGRGGMGEVWRAEDSRGGRSIVLKLVTTEALSDPELAERFRRECRIAGEIHHPHVLPVYDYSVDGTPYIVMPYIDGTDLATAIMNSGRLPAERAVNIVEQVASALDAAHRRGLRHRDVKPSNIMLEPGARTDHAWLFDWGIAQPIDTTGAPPVTRVGHLVGTPAYIAPERLDSKQTPDHRADVYSLAVVLYECLCGTTPFTGEDMAVLTAHLCKEPPPLPDSVPAGLRDVVAKGLAKGPDERYQSAGELGEAARAALDAASRPAPPPDPSPDPLPVPAPVTRSRWPRQGIAGTAAAGVVAAAVLWAAGLVDGGMLAWMAPLLGLAGGAVAAGVRGPRQEPDPPPPGPSDPTRGGKPGGFPPPRP